ncbi:MAG: PIN domain-containing protein [Thaumarchaeota archaeon]|nr:PIN domain-containing protein [Nitrososphaerota archaeon]
MIGSEGASARRRFVVDTNVFVSVIKPFSGRGPTPHADRGSLALLLKLITDPELELFGSLWLLDAYKRLAEELSSETAGLILGRLTAKMREVTDVGQDAVARCAPYLPEREVVDVLHAATCLQSKAVLITNDKDFDRIEESGMIEAWSISEAIEKLCAQG